MKYKITYTDGTIGEIETDETKLRLEQHAHIASVEELTEGEVVIEPVVEVAPEPAPEVVEPVVETPVEIIEEPVVEEITEVAQ